MWDPAGFPRPPNQQRSDRSRTPAQAADHPQPWPMNPSHLRTSSTRGRAPLHSPGRRERPSSRPRSLPRQGLPIGPDTTAEEVSPAATSALPMVEEEHADDHSILPIIAQIRQNTDIFSNCTIPFQSLSTMRMSLLKTREERE